MVITESKIVVHNGVPYGKQHLENIGVDQLRKMARDLIDEKAEPVIRQNIAFMKKTELIDTLLEKAGFDERPVSPFESPVSEPKHNDDGLADVLAKALEGRIRTSAVNEDTVRKIAAETVAGSIGELVTVIKKKTLPKQIVITHPDNIKIEIGVQHKKFETMLKLASLKLDMFLVGPAGSGKTQACESLAKALNLPFYFVPVGLQTTKSDLLGYMDVRGSYVTTHLRKAYEHGGVFLMDEIDAGNPNVLTVINAMLSNRVASFPDRMVERHENFIFVGAGNTYGHGGDIQYVGRNQIDAATLDRFVLVKFDYDEELENTFTDNSEWLKTVRSIRTAAGRLKEKLIVSPRAVIKGSRMLSLGFNIDDCLDMLIYRGISKDIRDRVEAERKARG